MKRPVPVESASALIDERIKELGDWRGKTLAKVREIVHEADPEILEEWKWMGTSVWSHGGIVCTGETYKNVVKMTFAKGAALKDPSGLFNSSLAGNVRRHRHPGRRQDRCGGLEGSYPRCSGAQSPSQEQAEAPASEQQAGLLASSQVPAMSPPMVGRPSAPASYAEQFGIETPDWPPKAAQES
jgi:hypothetical protein